MMVLGRAPREAAERARPAEALQGVGDGAPDPALVGHPGRSGLAAQRVAGVIEVGKPIDENTGSEKRRQRGGNDTGRRKRRPPALRHLPLGERKHSGAR